MTQNAGKLQYNYTNLNVFFAYRVITSLYSIMAVNANSVARVANSLITGDTEDLQPLYSMDTGELLVDGPRNVAEINSLPGELASTTF